MKTEFLGGDLRCFKTIDSTNNYLKSNAGQLADGTVAISDEQTAGKGRRGNKWTTNEGQALAMSFLIKNINITKMPPVTLICGLAAAKALNLICGGGFFIKWPNDIVCEGKKICGILCESKISKAYCATVCGIGVNISQDKEFFDKIGLPSAASLKMLKGDFERETIAAEILNRFEEIYLSLKQGGENETAAFFREYTKVCITLGRRVRAVSEKGELVGTAEKLGPDGTLIVRCGDKTVTVSAGEVSIRGIMGYM